MKSFLRIQDLGAIRPLVLLTLSALALPTSGCGPLSCTEAGCHDGLIVDLSHRLVEGDYRVKLTTSNGVTQCDFRVVADSNLEEFSCDSKNIHLHSQWFSLYTHPESIEVSISRVETDENVTEQFEVDYKRESPNGDKCGPICHFATVELDTSALIGPDGGGGAGGN